MQALINWALRYIADLDLPVKRGTFVDFRTGLVNFSPAGRHLSKVSPIALRAPHDGSHTHPQEERAKWVAFDVAHGVRKTMVEKMRAQFPAWNLDWVIGGQMGFDVFIKGWDKTFCLQYLDQFQVSVVGSSCRILLTSASIQTVHFFGDRIEPGGNDYPLYIHPRVTAHGITTETEGRPTGGWHLFPSHSHRPLPLFCKGPR